MSRNFNVNLRTNADNSNNGNDESERTVYCGNLNDRVTEEILYELFLQCGPIESVRIPKKGDRPSSFGFVTFSHACSVPYAKQLLHGVKLYNREISIQNRSLNNALPLQLPLQQSKVPPKTETFLDSLQQLTAIINNNLNYNMNNDALRQGFTATNSNISHMLPNMISKGSSNSLIPMPYCNFEQLRLNLMEPFQGLDALRNQNLFDISGNKSSSSSISNHSSQSNRRHNSRSYNRPEPYSRKDRNSKRDKYDRGSSGRNQNYSIRK